VLVFEIAGGILLAALVLATIRNPIKASIYGLTALAFAVGLFLFIWAWDNVHYPLEKLAMFVLIFSAYLFYKDSQNKDARKEVARLEKEQKDADFKIFLAESLERRRQREGRENVL